MSSTACVIHQWHRDEQSLEFQCTMCEARTVPCRECGRPMLEAGDVCTPCITSARRVVSDIWGWLSAGYRQDPYEPLKAIAYDRDRVSGGNDDERLPFGLDRVVSDPEDARIANLKTVPDALRVLDRWAEAWRRYGGITSELHDPVAFLIAYTEWAIRNPEQSYWTLYIRDARQVRAVIRRLLGIAPVAERVPCIYCGGRVVHEWTDDGLEDQATCTQCGTVWEHSASLQFASRHFLRDLPTTNPDQEVTLEQLKAIFRDRVRVKLLDLWAHRRKIEPLLDDVGRERVDARGERLYRLGDVAALVVEYEAKHRAEAS